MDHKIHAKLRNFRNRGSKHLFRQNAKAWNCGLSGEHKAFSRWCFVYILFTYNHVALCVSFLSNAVGLAKAMKIYALSHQ